MHNIKMFRLKNGEDIIANILHEDGFTLKLKEPMIVEISTERSDKKDYVSMFHWLPIPILAVNEISIDRNEILFEMIPSEDFFEFYESQLQLLNAREEAKEQISKMNEEELINMWKLFQLNPEQNNLH